MPKKSTTEPNLKLSVKKEQAVDLALLGETITSIAKSLDVSRTTVYAWFGDPDVEAVLNLRRAAMRKIQEDRVEVAVNTALEVVLENLTSDDADTDLAFRLLQAAKVLDGNRSAIGPTNAELIRATRAVDDDFLKLLSQRNQKATTGGGDS